jgi:hypothetical protein
MDLIIFKCSKYPLSGSVALVTSKSPIELALDLTKSFNLKQIYTTQGWKKKIHHTITENQNK